MAQNPVPKSLDELLARAAKASGALPPLPPLPGSVAQPSMRPGASPDLASRLAAAQASAPPPMPAPAQAAAMPQAPAPALLPVQPPAPVPPPAPGPAPAPTPAPAAYAPPAPMGAAYGQPGIAEAPPPASPFGEPAPAQPVGEGFFGPVPGPDGVARPTPVLTADVGRGAEPIPAMVPGLNQVEIDHLASGGAVTETIANKAKVFAQLRFLLDQPAWPEPGEVYPLPSAGEPPEFTQAVREAAAQAQAQAQAQGPAVQAAQPAQPMPPMPPGGYVPPVQ